MPHWRYDGSVYFVTWRLHEGQPELVAGERALVLDAVRHFDGDRYALLATVVMNDHVHVVVRPAPGQVLERLCHAWKSWSAHRMQATGARVGKVWLNESFDHIVRDEEELRRVIEYVRWNPEKRWPGVREYPFAYVVQDFRRHLG